MNCKIVICDDCPADSSYVSAFVKEWANLNGHEIELTLLDSAEKFLSFYEEGGKSDILLLDIEMPGMDGVTLAKKLRQNNETMQIVFVTGYSDYISEGYDVSALHYLMKPVKREKMLEVLSRAAERIQKNERVLTLEASGELVRVPIHEISYLEVNQNYVTVHAKKEYTVKRALAEFDKELDERFFRAGRSCIINLTMVQRVTKTEAVLTGGITVPLPRGMDKQIGRAIIERI